MFPHIHLGVANSMVNMNNVNIMAMRCHRQPRDRVLLDQGCCAETYFRRMKEVSKGFKVKQNDEWFIKTWWPHWNYQCYNGINNGSTNYISGSTNDSNRSTSDSTGSTSDSTGSTSDSTKQTQHQRQFVICQYSADSFSPVIHC